MGKKIENILQDIPHVEVFIDDAKITVHHLHWLESYFQDFLCITKS